LVEKEYGQSLVQKDLFLKTPKERESAKKEVESLFKLDHQHIIKYQHAFICGDGVSILMEYVPGGNLQDQIEDAMKKGAHIDEALIFKWASHICKGLKYLHKKKIVHRNLKLQNVLITADGDAKLTDVGIVKAVEDAIGKPNSFAGNKPYMSPEVLGEETSDSKSDIWALGVIVYQLYTFVLPFEKAADQAAAKVTPLPKARHSSAIQEIVKRTLVKNPEERPTAKDLGKLIKELKVGGKPELPESIAPHVLSGITCKKILKGHTSAVHAVLQLSDGRLVSSSFDRLVKIWNLEKGTCELSLKGHEGFVWGLLELKNGKLASSSEDKTIKIWNSLNGFCESTINTTSQCLLMTELYDGRIAVGSSTDGKIRIINIDTKAIEKTLVGHSKEVWEVIQLDDGRLASSGWEYTVKIWNISTETCDATLKGHASSVKGLHQLEDGRLISGAWDNTIKVWNLQTYACENTIKAHVHWVYKVNQISKTQLISTSEDKSIRVTNLHTGAIEHKYEGHTGAIYGLALLSGGGFATAATDSTIRIWQ